MKQRSLSPPEIKVLLAIHAGANYCQAISRHANLKQSAVIVNLRSLEKRRIIQRYFKKPAERALNGSVPYCINYNEQLIAVKATLDGIAGIEKLLQPIETIWERIARY